MNTARLATEKQGANVPLPAVFSQSDVSTLETEKMFTLEDLRFPAMELLEAPRPALILYLAFRLHVNENGECRQARWMGAMVGLNREEYEPALRFLIEHGLIDTFKYEDVYGLSTGARLRNYKAMVLQERLPWQAWRALRLRVFQRDEYICAYCGGTFEIDGLECDHIEPISLGGTNELGNLVTACAECNRRKRANLLSAWKLGAI